MRINDYGQFVNVDLVGTDTTWNNVDSLRPGPAVNLKEIIQILSLANLTPDRLPDLTGEGRDCSHGLSLVIVVFWLGDWRVSTMVRSGSRAG